MAANDPASQHDVKPAVGEMWLKVEDDGRHVLWVKGGNAIPTEIEVRNGHDGQPVAVYTARGATQDGSGAFSPVLADRFFRIPTYR